MKKITSIVLAFLSLVSLSGIYAFQVIAANEGTVTATVTAQNISLTVTDGTVSYGILPASTSKSTISTDLNDTQTATNNGNVAEDINIKGANSANWTIAATAGAEQFVHKFCTASCSTLSNFTALTTNNQTLVSNLAVDGTQTFDLQITTPSSTATFTPQSVNVTVQAVAH